MRRPATRRNRPRRRGIVIIDSSAVMAILFREPSADFFLAALAAHPVRLMSVANYVATGTVLAGRRRSDRTEAISDLDALPDEAGIGLVPIDAAQARIALDARIRYGRGMGHGGVLNFGDAFAHALAKCMRRRYSIPARTSARRTLPRWSAQAAVDFAMPTASRTDLPLVVTPRKRG